MNEHEPTTTADPTPDPTPHADRPPTQDEATAADRAARSVDMDRTAAHFEEMNEVGAAVKGEGEIES